MLSKDIQRDIKQIAVGVGILSAVMAGIFAALNRFDWTVLWGTLLGAVFTVVNFILLSFTVQKALDGGKGKAQAVMSTSYTLRLILTAAMVIFAIKSPYIHYVAAIIPLIFPRLIILFLNMKKKKKINGQTESTDVIKR